MTDAMRARKEAEDDQRLDDQLRKRARILCAAAEINQDELAELMGMSRPTLWKRLKAPGTFSLAEYRRFRRLENRFVKGGDT